MRILATAAFLGMVSILSSSAWAQSNNTGYTPLYNTSTTAPVYYSATNGVVPVYNNSQTTPYLPMDQMVAGKNAPSYDFNQTNNAYQFGTNGQVYGGSGAITPAQQAQLDAQYQALQDAQLQAAQQQYLNSLQPQQQVAPGALASYNSIGYPGNYNLVGGPYGTTPAASAAPTQRRVRYKELNNPLKAPPRLFNPDQ